jgi:hypothetical protein
LPHDDSGDRCKPSFGACDYDHILLEVRRRPRLSRRKTQISEKIGAIHFWLIAQLGRSARIREN